MDKCLFKCAFSFGQGVFIKTTEFLTLILYIENNVFMYSSITLNILKTLMAQYLSYLSHGNALKLCLYDFRIEKLYNTCRQHQQANMHMYDPCTRHATVADDNS